jgi:4-diphosphocytidyl-2-C-methyl-D-erythritol kinase
MTVKAPAKINLFLHVVGRRADGYHELQTAFDFVDLCDELEFRIRDDGAIQLRGDLSGVAEQQNLVWRAAALLKQHCAIAAGADIVLRKRIPHGAGLGGGSSDAAATLRTLNELWACGLDEDRLAELGLRLGADVPVFVRGRPALAEGVGERLIPVTLPSHAVLLVKPAFGLSTPDIFRHPDLTRDTPRAKIAIFANDALPFWAFCKDSRNDLAAVACQIRPELRYLLIELDRMVQQLGSGAQFARMSGSGSCCFVVFDTFEQAKLAEQDLRHRVLHGWPTAGEWPAVDLIVAAQSLSSLPEPCRN